MMTSLCLFTMLKAFFLHILFPNAVTPDPDMLINLDPKLPISPPNGD